jgi:hypothetical protein
VQCALECVDVVEREEGESLAGEDDFVLLQGTSDEVVGHVAGDFVCEWLF